MKVMHDLPKNIVKYKHLTAIEQFREAADMIYNPMIFVGTIESVHRQYSQVFADLDTPFNDYIESKDKASEKVGHNILAPLTDTKKLRLARGLLFHLNRELLTTVKVIDHEIVKITIRAERSKEFFFTQMKEQDYRYSQKILRISELYVLESRLRDLYAYRKLFLEEQEMAQIAYERIAYKSNK
jgi:hypothetical protein